MSTGRVGYGKELNYPSYLGQVWLERSLTLSFHNNLPYPPPYFGYPDWESVTLCKYQYYPTLDTYLSLSYLTRVPTLPYPPSIEYLPHLPHARHLSVHTCTHLTIPHNTFCYIPQPAFPSLYYCQGLIKYKAELIYQIRPKLPKTETTRAEMTQAETTQGRNDSGLKRTSSECSCGCRTGTYM